MKIISLLFLIFICFLCHRGKRTSVASRRVVRPAKKKAMLYLTEKSVDNKNINSVESVIIPPSPHPLPAQQSKTGRCVTKSVATNLELSNFSLMCICNKQTVNS